MALARAKTSTNNHQQILQDPSNQTTRASSTTLRPPLVVTLFSSSFFGEASVIPNAILKKQESWGEFKASFKSVSDTSPFINRPYFFLCTFTFHTSYILLPLPASPFLFSLIFFAMSFTPWILQLGTATATDEALRRSTSPSAFVAEYSATYFSWKGGSLDLRREAFLQEPTFLVKTARTTPSLLDKV